MKSECQETRFVLKVVIVTLIAGVVAMVSPEWFAVWIIGPLMLVVVGGLAFWAVK